jgi:cytochrome c
MPWGILPDSVAAPPSIAHAAIYLPEDEIANSPSQPILMQDGPYKGQMLHGDVTHGGIKRDFLEKINGEYQGAVFRFTQGLEAV